MSKLPCVAAIPGYQGLRDELCRSGGFEVCRLKERPFSNGEIERIVRKPYKLVGRPLILLGGCGDKEIVQTIDFASHLSKFCGSLELVLPFTRYSTAEKRKEDEPGLVLAAQVRMNMLNVIPRARAGNRLFFVDLHNPSMEGFVNQQHFTPFLLHTNAYLAQVTREELGNPDDLVVSTADEGRPDTVESFAGLLGAPMVEIAKSREREAVTTGALRGEVQDRYVIIRDDMIRSASTAAGAVDRCMAAGARGVALVCAHLELIKRQRIAVERLRQSGLDKVIVLDTCQRAESGRRQASDLIVVRSIAPFLCEQLKLHGLGA